jgi:hypothetical protein
MTVELDNPLLRAILAARTGNGPGAAMSIVTTGVSMSLSIRKRSNSGWRGYSQSDRILLIA